jgi:hypothetical protein
MTYGFDIEKSRVSRSNTYKRVKQTYPNYEPDVNARNITEKKNSNLNTLRNITQKKQYGGRAASSRGIIDRIASIITSKNLRAAEKRGRLKLIMDRNINRKDSHGAVRFNRKPVITASDKIALSMKESAREIQLQQEAFVRQRAVLTSSVTPVIVSKYAEPVNFDNSTGSQLALVRMAMITEESRQVAVFNKSFVQGLLGLGTSQSSQSVQAYQGSDTGFIPVVDSSPVDDRSLEIAEITIAIQEISATIETAATNAAKYEEDFKSSTIRLDTLNTTVVTPLTDSINTVSQTIVNKIYTMYTTADSLVESMVSVNKVISDSMKQFYSLSSRLGEVRYYVSNTPPSIDTTSALNDYLIVLSEYTNSISLPANMTPSNMNMIRNSILAKLTPVFNELSARYTNIESAKAIAQSQLDTASRVIKDIPGQKQTAINDFFQKIPGGLSQSDIASYRSLILTYENAVNNRNTNITQITNLRNGLVPSTDLSNLDSLSNNVNIASSVLNDPTTGLIALMEISRPPQSLLPSEPTPILVLTENVDSKILIDLETSKLEVPFKTLQDTATALDSIDSILKVIKPNLDSLYSLYSGITVIDAPTMDAILQIKAEIEMAGYSYTTSISNLLLDVSVGLASLYNISKTQNSSKKFVQTKNKNTAYALAVQAKLQFVVNLPVGNNALSNKELQLNALQLEIISKNVSLESYKSILLVFDGKPQLAGSDRANLLKTDLVPGLTSMINSLNSRINGLVIKINTRPPIITPVKPVDLVIDTNSIETLEANKSFLEFRISLLVKYKNDVTLKYQNNLFIPGELTILYLKQSDKSSEVSSNLTTKMAYTSNQKSWYKQSSTFKSIYSTIYASIKSLLMTLSKRATNITNKKSDLAKIEDSLIEINTVNTTFKFDTAITLSRLITLTSIKYIVNTEKNIRNININISVISGSLRPSNAQTGDVAILYLQMKEAENSYTREKDNVTTNTDTILNIQTQIILNVRVQVDLAFNFYIKRNRKNLVILQSSYSSSKENARTLQQGKVVTSNYNYSAARYVKENPTFSFDGIKNTVRKFLSKTAQIVANRTNLEGLQSSLTELFKSMTKYDSILGLTLFKKRDSLQNNIQSLIDTIRNNLEGINTQLVIVDRPKPLPFNDSAPTPADRSLLNTLMENLTNLNKNMASVKSNLSFYTRILMMIEALKRRFVERVALINDQTNKNNIGDTYATEKADAHVRKVEGYRDAKSIKDALPTSKKDSIIDSLNGQKSKADEITTILNDISILNDMINDSKKYSLYDKAGRLRDIQSKILTLIQYRTQLDSQIAKLKELISRLENLLNLSSRDREKLRNELNKLKDNLARMEKERLHLKDYITKLEIRLRQLLDNIRNLERIPKPETRLGKPDVRNNFLSNLGKYLPIVGVVGLAAFGLIGNPPGPTTTIPRSTTTADSQNGCSNGTKEGTKDGASAGFKAGLAEATRQYNIWRQEYLLQIPPENTSENNSNSMPTTTSSSNSKTKSNNNSNSDSNSNVKLTTSDK